jgi:hypothetical protein
VFPHLEGYYSKTIERITSIDTGASFSNYESFTFEDDTKTYINSGTQTGKTVDKVSSYGFIENKTYRDSDAFCISGQTEALRISAGSQSSSATGEVAIAPPLFIGSGSDSSKAGYSGTGYDYGSSIIQTIGSDGVIYNAITDNRTNSSSTFSFTNVATFYAGVTGSASRSYSRTLLISSYISNNRYTYQDGETRYNDFTSFYSSDYILQGTNLTSAFTSYSSEYITTLYPTQESTSFFTSQTGDETSQTATTSETYEGRYRHTIFYTATTTDTPYILSTQTNITFTYLSQTTSTSGTNSFLTITTYTTTATNIRTTTLDASRRPMLTMATTTSFYRPLGTPATALVNIGGNWANGGVGGYLIKIGNNGNLIQKFSALSVVVSNETFLPPLSMGRYTEIPNYNNDTDGQTFTEVRRVGTTSQLTLLNYETFINTLYGQNITDSTTYERYFRTTYSAEVYFYTTGTTDGVYYAGTEFVPYVGTVGFQSIRSRTEIGGSNRNVILIYDELAETTITAIQYSFRFANTSLSSTYYNSLNGGYYITYEDEGRSYERQSFNTATAKYHSYIGADYHEKLNVLGRKNGQYQLGNIYLHTSVSNKTNNTGYFQFSNNIGLYPHPVALSYNANTVISNDNQLSLFRAQADYEYLYANFAVNPRDNDDSYYNITPISQSSYSFANGEYPLYTEYTVSFGGVSDSGSYTAISKNFTNSTYSQTATGIIQFFFGLDAGTGYVFQNVNDSQHARSKSGLGGKRALYTDTQTLMPITNEQQFSYALRESQLTLKRPHNYTVVNYFTNTSTGSLSVQYGSILTGTSLINNLKFISLNEDSWFVNDFPLTGFGSASAKQLDQPSWASSAPIGGLMPYYEFSTYYGSTYFMY